MKRRLLLIGIDGLRVDRAFGTGLAPTLDALAARGSIRHATVEGPTISGPSWSSILTGATCEEHGVIDNTFAAKNLREGGDFLSRAAADDPATRTYAISTWEGIARSEGPGPILATRPEQIAAGLHRNIVIDYRNHVGDPDDEVCDQAVTALMDGVIDVGFVYLGTVDGAGHTHGGLSEEYDEAVRAADMRVARLLGALQRRVDDAGEQWIVAITTDHGHTDAGGHGGDSDLERRTFLLVDGVGTTAVQVPDGIRPVQFTELLLAAR